MLRTSTLLTFFLASGSLVASDLNTERIRKEFEQRIRKYTLKNGLRVVLMKNGMSPTLACYLKVGVGSSNEPFNQAGTAHFLEHLLFKGTSEMGTRDFKRERIYLDQIAADGERIDHINRQLADPLVSKATREKLIEKRKELKRRVAMIQKLQQRLIISEEDSMAYSLAGEVGYNAYTTADVTNYQIKLPKNRLELWAWLESRRFLDPIFREFYPERLVILEERRMRYDSKPGNLLHELYLKTAYGMSPYGKPVIGFASNIDNLRLSDTKTFFNNNYIPSRMVITIVGDLEFEAAFKIIEKYFSELPERPTPAFPSIQFEGGRGRKTAVLAAKHSPTMITGWHKPSIYHKDDLAFEVLSKLLTSGQTSRLVRTLVLKKRLTSYVRAYNGNPGEKLPNNFSIYMGAYDEAKYTEIESVIRKELEELSSKGPSRHELTKVKNQFYAELINSLASNAGLANSLSYYELLLNDYRMFFEYLEQLKKIEPSDIQRIIDTYLIDANNTTVYIRRPE